jgi:hypothetical protein
MTDTTPSYDELAQGVAAGLKKIAQLESEIGVLRTDAMISKHQFAKACELLGDIRAWMFVDLGDWDAEFIERIDALVPPKEPKP